MTTQPETPAPILIRGDDLHDAVVVEDHGRWTCGLCGRQAMHAEGTAGMGVMHTDCFLVTAEIILNRNQRGVHYAEN